MKRSLAIVGSGPSALMLGCLLDENQFDVTIYEKNFSPARKFLVAGDGGFNLTHSEEPEAFVSRYTPSAFLEKSIRAFSNEDLRAWLKTLNIDTFVGSSKRVFPVKGIKPIDVLNVILDELKRKNVSIKTLHEWKGWNEKKELIFETKQDLLSVNPDITVFALGGASWSKTGSDGGWVKFFEEKKIHTVPFLPSNCAYKINWDKGFLSQWEGKSLKNISLSCIGVEKSGELVVTVFGIEGGAVYALSPQIRAELSEKNKAIVLLDLKPTYSVEKIKTRLVKKTSGSLTQLLKDELNLSGLQVSLLKSLLTKEEFIDTGILAERIKHLPLTITEAAPIDEAISTVGGISLNEVDEYFELKKMKSSFVIGEMLDWDAPTGGYLLQACFSMGYTVAQTLNAGNK